jgi:hypothetical protein
MKKIIVSFESLHEIHHFLGTYTLVNIFQILRLKYNQNHIIVVKAFTPHWFKELLKSVGFEIMTMVNK